MPVNQITVDTTTGSDTAFLKMGYLNYISIATPTLNKLVVVFPCVPPGYMPQGQNDFYNTGSVCVDVPVKFTSPMRPTVVESIAACGGTFFQGAIVCTTPNIGEGSCTPAGCYDLTNQQWDLWSY